MRWSTIVMAGAMLAACSGSGSSGTEPGLPPTSSAAPVEVATSTTLGGEADAATVAPEPGPTGLVEIVLDSESATIAGELAGSDDPFGEFVSCSGLREVFTTYSVLASVTEGELRSVSAVTTTAVVAEGIHDAVVRVEFDDGSVIDATGTMTLLPGFQTGSFIAFDAAGTPVEGSFSCDGPDGAMPIEIGTADDVLDQIDVFALLRQGQSARLVGFAVSGESSASTRCPGASGVQSDLVVGVDGDDSIGAITAFELVDGAVPQLSMRVGAVTYEFDEVVLGGSNTGDAGSFSAESGGVIVDGAYRCS